MSIFAEYYPLFMELVQPKYSLILFTILIIEIIGIVISALLRLYFSKPYGKTYAVIKLKPGFSWLEILFHFLIFCITVLSLINDGFWIPIFMIFVEGLIFFIKTAIPSRLAYKPGCTLRTSIWVIGVDSKEIQKITLNSWTRKLTIQGNGRSVSTYRTQFKSTDEYENFLDFLAEEISNSQVAISDNLKGRLLISQIGE